MRKQRTFLSAALVISVAALLPTVAVAANDPQLTYPTGTLISVVPEPPKLSATSIGFGRFSDSFGSTLSQCLPFFTGSLEKNSGSAFEMTLGTANLGCSGWTVTTNAPWCLRSTSLMAEDEFQIRREGCTSAPRFVTLVINSCKYERASPVAGTYKTDVSGEDALLVFSHVEFVREFGQLCATPEKIFFEAVMTLETDTSTTADPIYIS